MKLCLALLYVSAGWYGHCFIRHWLHSVQCVTIDSNMLAMSSKYTVCSSAVAKHNRGEGRRKKRHYIYGCWTDSLHDEFKCWVAISPLGTSMFLDWYWAFFLWLLSLHSIEPADWWGYLRSTLVHTPPLPPPVQLAWFNKTLTDMSRILGNCAMVCAAVSGYEDIVHLCL